MATSTYEQAKAAVVEAIAAGRLTPEAGQAHLQDLVATGYAAKPTSEPQAPIPSGTPEQEAQQGANRAGTQAAEEVRAQGGSEADALSAGRTASQQFVQGAAQAGTKAAEGVRARSGTTEDQALAAGSRASASFVASKKLRDASAELNQWAQDAPTKSAERAVATAQKALAKAQVAAQTAALAKDAGSSTPAIVKAAKDAEQRFQKAAAKARDAVIRPPSKREIARILVDTTPGVKQDDGSYDLVEALNQRHITPETLKDAGFTVPQVTQALQDQGRQRAFDAIATIPGVAEGDSINLVAAIKAGTPQGLLLRAGFTVDQIASVRERLKVEQDFEPFRMGEGFNIPAALKAGRTEDQLRTARFTNKQISDAQAWLKGDLAAEVTLVNALGLLQKYRSGNRYYLVAALQDDHISVTTLRDARFDEAAIIEAQETIKALADIKRAQQEIARESQLLTAELRNANQQDVAALLEGLEFNKARATALTELLEEEAWMQLGSNRVGVPDESARPAPLRKAGGHRVLLPTRSPGLTPEGMAIPSEMEFLSVRTAKRARHQRAADLLDKSGFINRNGRLEAFAALQAGIDPQVLTDYGVRNVLQLQQLASQLNSLEQLHIAAPEQSNTRFIKDVLKELFTFGQVETVSDNRASLGRRYDRLELELAQSYWAQVREIEASGQTVLTSEQDFLRQTIGTRNAYISSVISAQPTLARVAKDVGVASIPIYGTARYWSEAPNWARALSVASDIAFIIPVVGQASALARGGATATQIASRVGVSSVTGPIQAVRHPLRTIQVMTEPLETAIRPSKLPINVSEVRETTLRIPALASHQVTPGDVKIPRIALEGLDPLDPLAGQSLITLQELRGHVVEPHVRATMAARDRLTKSAIEGQAASTFLGAGDLTILQPSFQRVVGPAAVHSTPDIRYFMLGTTIGDQETRQLFVAPSMMSRFIRQTASGNLPELSPRVQEAIALGKLADKPVPGAVIIRDPQVLAALRDSNLLWRGSAEIERTLPVGTTLPPPSQFLFTRMQGGERVTLAIIGDPLTPAEIAKLKFVGSADVVRSIFRRPGKYRATTTMDQAVDAGRQVEQLWDDAASARKAGNMQRATLLEKQAVEQAAKTDRLMADALKEAGERVGSDVQPLVLYTGRQKIDEALKVLGQPSTIKTQTPSAQSIIALRDARVISPQQSRQLLRARLRELSRKKGPSPSELQRGAGTLTKLSSGAIIRRVIQAKLPVQEAVHLLATRSPSKGPTRPQPSTITRTGPGATRARPISVARARPATTRAQPSQASKPGTAARTQPGPTDRPGTTAAQRPGAARTQPGAIDRPGPGTTTRPGPGTTTRPGPGTPTRPGPGTTTRPGPGTPTRPGPGTTTRPGPGTPTRPGPGTPTRRGPGTTTRPGPGTTPVVIPVIPDTKPPGSVPFILPSGKQLPAGSFPLELEWPQGAVKVTYNMVTDQAKYTKRRPDKTTPADGLVVVSFTQQAPTPRELRMGLFDVVITARTLTFRRSNRKQPLAAQVFTARTKKRPPVRSRGIGRRQRIFA